MSSPDEIAKLQKLNDEQTETPPPANAPDHRKPCTLCSKPCNVRIRCQIDKTGTWHLVCPGKCWNAVSGGVIDGDKAPEHKYYRYGGVWKNKHDAVSGKKPKKKKKKKSEKEKKEKKDDVELGGDSAGDGQDAARNGEGGDEETTVED